MATGLGWNCQPQEGYARRRGSVNERTAERFISVNWLSGERGSSCAPRSLDFPNHATFVDVFAGPEQGANGVPYGIGFPILKPGSGVPLLWLGPHRSPVRWLRLYAFGSGAPRACFQTINQGVESAFHKTPR